MNVDRRAVSIAVTHALTFGITAVLVGALLLSAGQYLGAQERNVAENQFTDIGSDVVSHVTSFDRMNQSGSDVEVTIEPEYPERVVGERYSISIEGDPPEYLGTEYALVIESGALDDPLAYPLETDTTLDDVDGEATSDDLTICLRDGEISLGVGCQ